MDVSGKVVVVTGSGNGIGRGLATPFVEEGARAVVISDLDPGTTAAVAAELGQPHRACDVGHPAAYPVPMPPAH